MLCRTNRNTGCGLWKENTDRPGSPSNHLSAFTIYCVRTEDLYYCPRIGHLWVQNCFKTEVQTHWQICKSAILPPTNYLLLLWIYPQRWGSSFPRAEKCQFFSQIDQCSCGIKRWRKANQGLLIVPLRHLSLLTFENVTFSQTPLAISSMKALYSFLLEGKKFWTENWFKLLLCVDVFFCFNT